jgi:hypothetical protein
LRLRFTAAQAIRQRSDVDTSRWSSDWPAIALTQHCEQNMHRLDVLIVVADGDRLRVGECFLEFRRQFVESHSFAPQAGYTPVAGVYFGPAAFVSSRSATLC